MTSKKQVKRLAAKHLFKSRLVFLTTKSTKSTKSTKGSDDEPLDAALELRVLRALRGEVGFYHTAHML